MKRTIVPVVLVAFLAGLLAIACDDDGNTIIQPEPQATATVSFDNYVGNPATTGVPVAISLSNLQYTNSFNVAFSVSRLQYIVSDVRLHMTNGRTVGMDGIHFRDQEQDITRSMSMSVPQGTYNKISFTFGLDETKNVKDRYLDYDKNGVNPQQFQADMAWPGPMGGDNGIGYHYMKIEGNFEQTPGGSTLGYTTHTGARFCSNGCNGGADDTFAHHHYFRVEIPFNAVSVGEGGIHLTVDMDIIGWYADIDPADAYDSDHDWRDLAMQMIMPNLVEQQKLMTNGPQCFTVEVSAP